MQLTNLGQVINVASFGASYPASSAPIFLQPRIKALSSTVNFTFPGAGEVKDVVGVEFIASVTAQSGTSPTLQLQVQGANDLDGLTTLTAAVATGDSSITLANRTGIPQFGWAMLVSASGQNYEWVLVTSAAATGAGAHTVTRSQFGTSARQFAVGDFLVFPTSWAPIPTRNATTTVLQSAAASITSAAAATPVIITVSSHGLGMDSIDYPIIRVVGILGGTTPTASYTVTGAMKVRSKFDVSK